MDHLGWLISTVVAWWGLRRPAAPRAGVSAARGGCRGGRL